MRKQPTPRYQPKFKEWKPRKHLRQDEIDALPRKISMGGIGNGKERVHGFGRGR